AQEDRCTCRPRPVSQKSARPKEAATEKKSLPQRWARVDPQTTGRGRSLIPWKPCPEGVASQSPGSRSAPWVLQRECSNYPEGAGLPRYAAVPVNYCLPGFT